MKLMVKNDLYDYPHRYIMQYEDDFKFSIDSLLLAEYVKLNNNVKNILDFCTGNAPVPLSLSLRTKANIVGIEIQEDIWALAIESIKINNLEEQITVINDDLKNICNYYKYEYFDIITCNPPFFKVSNGNYTNKNEALSIARHEIKTNLEEIFKVSFKMLKNNGKLYMVHRANRIDDIMYYAKIYRLNVKNVQFISTKCGSKPEIVLVTCVKNSKSGVIVSGEKCVDKLTTYQHLFEE